MPDHASLRELIIEAVPATFVPCLIAEGFQSISLDAYTRMYFRPAFEPDAAMLCAAWGTGHATTLVNLRGADLTGTPDAPVALRLRKLSKSIGPHTDIELDLMLSGKKTVAMFETIPEGFEPYLASGDFQRIGLDPYTQIIYASDHEASARELCDVVEKARRLGWEEVLERRIGELLGYEPADIDAFIQHVFPTPPRPDRTVQMP